MSGFLPDLANWALRGGAGDRDPNENDENADNSDGNAAGGADSENQEQLSEADVRARRLARMEAMMIQPSHPQQQVQQQQPVPMDIDKEEDKVKKKATMDVSPPRKKSPFGKKSPSSKQSSSNQDQAHQKKKAKESHSSNGNTPADTARKAQRKKELLLKKVLSLSIAGTCTSSDSSCVVLALDDTTITVQTIAELLATRLSLSPESPLLRTIPSQRPLMPYLAQCHRRASEEAKTLRQSSGSSKKEKDKEKNAELEEILEEIKRQVVSYSASSLMEPDLFELAKDGSAQLAKALLNANDPTSSITFGVAGLSSSFYYCLCEELMNQDKATFDKVMEQVSTYLMSQLSKCESVDDGAGETSALRLVVALTSVLVHKKAALAVTKMPKFLLPPADSPEANELVRPPIAANFLSMLAGENRPYKRRSGPALEKDTLLGLCLRVATPKNNPAFSPTTILRQSLDSVERATNQQRSSLRVYQEALNQLILAFVKSGVEARGKVMNWFIDCMLVNTGASAIRPDQTKVSSTAMLLNVSIVLLRLCEPFVVDERKHHLIDPGFVSAPDAHCGVYATSGDDAVPRLGEAADSAAGPNYEPKNAFIPQCFFFAARSLQLGIVPLLSHHENLLRHISHAHWELSSQNRDIQSDPHFCILVSKQRSNEVTLFQEELISDTMRFCNLMARVLHQMPDEVLSQMPEHFVDNICDSLMSVAKMKPKLLRGLEIRFVFKLVVKLLSAKYSTMVRNYNLRAMLGDVLYELYLPSDGDDRRDLPSSVACDPLAGGQTYLLSDVSAQETLAPSLLLLYGEVEHTGYYDKMSHRAKISSLLKYLWESSEHRPAFRSITQNKESFIKFANGIMNETNTLIATVMQKLPEIREAQEKMANSREWGQLSEDEQTVITSRLEDNEREVKHALPLCNKTLQMFGYLNTDRDIRILFLLDELCPRLVTMLLHVLTKLVGSKGLDLKVNNPEQYDFRPKEMLRDLCAIFALFASSSEFQVECAKSGCNPELLRSAVKTCRRLNLLTGESMSAFESLPDLVEKSSRAVEEDEALLTDAPEEFLDEIMSTFMMDPVVLPSGHLVDRSTITQHLLNDPIDPFNREEMTIEDVKPATELKARMTAWLDEKRAARNRDTGGS